MSTPLPPGADTIRTRFSPSPTGTPHVGLMRTALFDWAFARHNKGKLVFRIEDTDASRDSEESYQALLDAMRWLGLDWDEGVEVGGTTGPYRQSERRSVYADVAARLLAAGELYESFSSNEEVEARHRAAARDPKLGYDNFDRDLTADQRDAYRAEGRQPVLRLRMPDHDITFTDLVRGEITFKVGSVPDPVLVRGNGEPLYTLTNPVDDALMKVTHILRGEDLLPSTPRQIALFAALRRIGVAEFAPYYAHLPLVRGDGNKKLSKRDPESNLFLYRERGFLPEGLINYLALLGWAIADDRDVFGVAELVAAFDVTKVNPNMARFDLKKAEAINAAHLRALPADEFTRRVTPYLVAAGVLPERPSTTELAALTALGPLVQVRISVLSEAAPMLAFLFADEDTYAPEPESAARTLGPDADPVLAAAATALDAVTDWTADNIDKALKDSLVEGMGLKPRKAFAPVRVAVSGRTVAPPLYESLEVLGKTRTLRRLRGAITAKE